MRIRILSDLHFEFHADGGKAFVKSLDTSGCDVLVLAGDISNAAGITNALRLLCDHFEVPVVFVAGNHEYYGADLPYTRVAISAVDRRNFHDLESASYEHMSRRFIGGTLWFADTKGPEWAMNDFFVIKDLRDWVYRMNALVTHHLPSEVCVHPRYKGNPLNAFFVHDLTDLIATRKPALCIHGHTHESVDTMIMHHNGLGATRVICNTFGYVGHVTNPSFDPKFTVTI
jgi:Icc-related predicted phosphoesterase